MTSLHDRAVALFEKLYKRPPDNLYAIYDWPRVEHIEQALTDAVQEERDECAKVAERKGHDLHNMKNDYAKGMSRASIMSAQAIRQRQEGGG